MAEATRGGDRSHAEARQKPGGGDATQWQGGPALPPQEPECGAMVQAQDGMQCLSISLPPSRSLSLSLSISLSLSLSLSFSLLFFFTSCCSRRAREKACRIPLKITSRRVESHSRWMSRDGTDPKRSCFASVVIYCLESDGDPIFSSHRQRRQ